uniref:Putative bpti/kunitz family of serine protease inhibitor n=1 Tax=Amblyomma americanum TaxID=6943 RepID=A0A0C9SDF8_AMBAM
MKSWVFILLACFTLLEWSTTISIPEEGHEDVCSKPPEKGESCSSGFQGTKWYFNATTRTCSTFIYLGCGGNENRFPDNETCILTCDPPTYSYEEYEKRLEESNKKGKQTKGKQRKGTENPEKSQD